MPVSEGSPLLWPAAAGVNAVAGLLIFQSKVFQPGGRPSDEELRIMFPTARNLPKFGPWGRLSEQVSE